MIEIKTNQQIYNEIEKGMCPLVTKYVKLDDVRLEIHKKFGSILGYNETEKLLDKMFKELK